MSMTLNKEQNAQVIERIKYLMQELKLKQVQMAQMIDIDNSNLSKYINARIPISDSLVNRFVVNMGVNKEWLLNGTDMPFAKSPVQLQVDNGTVLTSPAAGQGTPVYDIDATAGVIEGRSNLFASDRIMGWINLPDISPDCRIVKVSGDSMSPVINDGDYVAVRELTNKKQIFWGQIYIVELENFRVLKYVRRHNDPQMLVLRSENSNYDDMDVYRSEVRDMLLVQHIMHLKTRI